MRGGRQQFEYEQKRKCELQGVMFMGYGAGGAAAFAVDAADFDGTDDILSRSTTPSFTGAAASKTGILSYWVYPETAAGSRYILRLGPPSGFGIMTNNLVTAGANVTANLTANVNAGGAVIVQVQDAGAGYAPNQWLHFLYAWDAASAVMKLYVNDVDETANVTTSNNNVEYNISDIVEIGGGFGTFFQGGMAEFYFAPGQFLDMTVEANRRKFRSATGKPVSLGATGATPTGSAPICFLHLDNGEAAANFATNRGTGGNLTVNGGGLGTFASSPSD